MKDVNAQTIFQLGAEVKDVINNNKMPYPATLTISGTEEWFKKIDEDIFYKLKSSGVIPEESEFIPSDDKITLNFERLSLEIVKK